MCLALPCGLFCSRFLYMILQHLSPLLCMSYALPRINNKVLSEHLLCHAKCWGLRQTLSEHCNHSLPQSFQSQDALWAGVSILETLPVLLQNHGGWCNVWPEMLYSVRICIILIKTLLNLMSLSIHKFFWINVEIYSKEFVSFLVLTWIYTPTGLTK